MAITLKDYAGGERHFILQEPQGKWIVAKGEPPEPTWGYATLVRQWYGLAAPVFVAVFTDRKTVLLRVGDRLFDLGDSRTLFRETWSGIPGKRFTVLTDGKKAASVAYNPLGIDRDPWDSDSIFDYLVQGFTDRTQLGRTVFVWTAVGEGRKLDSPEFVAELESKFGDQSTRQTRPDWRWVMCLAAYWLLFIILPAVLVLLLLPKAKRLGSILPIGFVLILIGEYGFRKWKKLWRVA
ncbi:MAG: hypothetical protein WCS01_01390 [bacterium]